MAKFYGQVSEDNTNKTAATRCGNHGIRAAAQTFSGSLIAIAEEDENKEIRFRLQINKDSSSDSGNTVFMGSLDELIQKLNATAIFA